MEKHLKRLIVVVNSRRSLHIYNPNGNEHQIVRGKAELEGYCIEVLGNAWVLFRSHRHFGLPYNAAPSDEARIELDLEEAASYGDITITNVDENPGEGTP